MRLAKFIAHSGYCSRRAADTYIQSGVVTVNNQTVNNFNTIINPRDCVKINGKSLTLPVTGVWLYHKPIQTITSKKDNQGRTTVFHYIPKQYQHLITIGRLDYNSEGILLFTNNGDLATHLTSPKNNIKRKYHVKVFGTISDAALHPVRQGITINGYTYQPIDVSITDRTKNNAWLSMTLTEGKNREIRNILSHLRLKISRLIRVEYAEFKLGKLPKNAFIKQEISHSKYDGIIYR